MLYAFHVAGIRNRVRRVQAGITDRGTINFKRWYEVLAAMVGVLGCFGGNTQEKRGADSDKT
jgi:hypothetical protein